MLKIKKRILMSKILRLHKNDLEDNIGEYILERLPWAKIQTVFDVGANRGWFTYQLHQSYPNACFYLFEPISSIVLSLRQNLERLGLKECDSLRINHTALGSCKATMLATAIPDCTINHIIKADEDISRLSASGVTPTEMVDVDTGDSFCNLNGISHIDYLKVDCEGHDLEVLEGFRSMLQQGLVKFVQVECRLGTRSEFSDGISYEDVDQFLAPFNYCLFRVINQASSFSPFISRADIIWISRSYATELAEEFGT